MVRPSVVFANLPIERKLLLVSVIPILVLLLLSLITYRSVSVFSNDEEQLANIYLVQHRAAEYMRLAVDIETGFRGYVLTRQEAYLKPYLTAEDRIIAVGDSLIDGVSDREAQGRIMVQIQALVKRLMQEKDQLIEEVRAGHTAAAHHYLEQGRGHASMVAVRQQMHEFDRLEQGLLNEALARLSQDRSFMITVILGGGVVALVLMVLTLRLIARSITVPLVNLAKTVAATSGGSLPDLPVLDRQDETEGRGWDSPSAEISSMLTTVTWKSPVTLAARLSASGCPFASHPPLLRCSLCAPRFSSPMMNLPFVPPSYDG